MVQTSCRAAYAVSIVSSCCMYSIVLYCMYKPSLVVVDGLGRAPLAPEALVPAATAAPDVR